MDTGGGDTVTWDALWRLLAVAGALVAVLWGLVIKMIYGKVSNEQLAAHFEDDKHRFEAIDGQFEQLSQSIADNDRRSREDLAKVEGAVRDGFRDVRADIRTALNRGQKEP